MSVYVVIHMNQYDTFEVKLASTYKLAKEICHAWIGEYYLKIFEDIQKQKEKFNLDEEKLCSDKMIADYKNYFKDEDWKVEELDIRLGEGERFLIKKAENGINPYPTYSSCCN